MKTPVSLMVIAMTATPLMLLAVKSHAAQFSYDYLEGSYSQSEIEFGNPNIEDTDFKGYRLSGSFSLSENLVVGGSFGTGEATTRANFNANTTGSLDISSTGPSLFVLYHDSLNAQAEYLVGVQAGQLEIEAETDNNVAIDQLSSDETLKEVFAGVRFHLNESLELEGRIEYDLDADDGEDEISYGIEARLNVASNTQVGVRFEPDDDGDTLTVSLRQNFP
ncbi:MAG: outer membrane beta-barrel protein [Granulosicoccus sp.]